jgi:exodeoxyribonuclease V alpha subunit
VTDTLGHPPGGAARAAAHAAAPADAAAHAALPADAAAHAAAPADGAAHAAASTDPHDARRARQAPGILRAFNDAGVLSAADVHVARRLTELAGEDDDRVRLAAALAVRGPRLGHVCVDLSTIRTTATVDADEAVDLDALPWPDPDAWLERLRASRLVAVDAEAADRPLRLEGTRLYLDRYWREETQVARDLGALAAAGADDVDLEVLRAGVARLFGAEAGGRQALAAAAAVASRFAVVAGGPGTGKTTAVARIVALLLEQAAAAQAPPPLVALAAPTGKAAARLQEAVRDEATRMDVAEEVRERLRALEASTLHRLLGWRPDSHSRFHHDRHNRLAHDVVIVDETSMVSLSLMARLVEAVRPGARLILVGDPGQLASIEAGAVLGDVVGPAVGGLRMRDAARLRLERATGHPVPAEPGPAIGDGVVVLERVHRFGGRIAEVAGAVRRGDAEATLAALRAGAAGPDGVADAVRGPGRSAGTPGSPADAVGGPAAGVGDDGAVVWIPADPADPEATDVVAAIRASAVGAARAVIEAARDGRAREALAALGAFRLLCAHRRGSHGVETWIARIEAWLAEDVERFGAEGPWYAGRPLLVTENDHALRLYNGDTGVVVAGADGRTVAAFERGGEVVELHPSRLSAVETAFAMTVHKSQGSQFDTVAVLLPDASSPLLTRELLYTAVTRSRRRLVLVGTEEAVRAAVERPVARASGLRARLWGA